MNNPTTNELAILPRPSEHSLRFLESMILVFHLSYSPHYKIIACATVPCDTPRIFDGHDYNLRRLEIYSSETKSWRFSGQPFLTTLGFKTSDRVLKPIFVTD